MTETVVEYEKTPSISTEIDLINSTEIVSQSQFEIFGTWKNALKRELEKRDENWNKHIKSAREHLDNLRKDRNKECEPFEKGIKIAQQKMALSFLVLPFSFVSA